MYRVRKLAKTWHVRLCCFNMESNDSANMARNADNS